MKVTGIELLQGIKDGNIKDGTKYTCGYCHRYVIVYDKEVYWGYSNDFNISEDIKYKPYNFAFANEKPIFRKLEQFQLMNTTFEIMEEPKFKVGDRVKVVKLTQGHYPTVKIGKITTITKVNESCYGNATSYEDENNDFYEKELELAEAPKVDLEEIDKIQYYYKNTYGNISQHKKSEIDIIDKINEIIENQNKFIKELNANSNRK